MLLILLGVIGLLGAIGAPVTAQEASPAATPANEGGPGGDPSFSNEFLPALGYPELTLRETGTTLEGVPASVPAGRFLVALTAWAESPADVDFVQVPAGLTPTETEDQPLRATAQDVAEDRWLDARRSYALPESTIHVVVELTPGEWQVAATRESVPPDSGEVQEWPTFHPIRVTAAVGTPAAGPVAEPDVDAMVELRDTAFGGLDAVQPAGPRLWKVTNTGEQPRQVVLFRTPRLIAAEEMGRIVAPIMGGIPTPGLPGFDEFVWVGYVAIPSPGQSVWIEFDLEPGSYTATS